MVSSQIQAKKRKKKIGDAKEEPGEGTAGPDLLDSPVEAAARAPSSLSPAVCRVPSQYAYPRKRERPRDEVEPRELPKSSTNALLEKGSISRRREQLTEAALAALFLRSSALALASVQHVEVSPVRRGGARGCGPRWLTVNDRGRDAAEREAREGRGGESAREEVANEVLDHDCTSEERLRMEEPQPKPPAVDLQLLPRAAREKVSPFPHVLLLAQRAGYGLCSARSLQCELATDVRREGRSGPSSEVLLDYLRADKSRGVHAYAETTSAPWGGRAFLYLLFGFGTSAEEGPLHSYLA